MKITISGKTYNNPVFVFAMEKEAGNEFKDLQRVFTGIGKVNAGYFLMKYLSVNKPGIIINLGTAGSTAFRRGDVVCCTQFVQRDMDVSPLGIEKFKTPFSDDDVVLDYGMDVDDLPKGICGTGDSFETEHNTDLYNVLDMEAYALALIAKREQIPFLCLKYISDGANDDAVEDWTQEINKASKILREVIATRF
ncbi:5'-methylthioadenosine/S-adenosylhomocysteine nucleosidase family protein [Elizabethkingia miricola]|uniref:Nucleosidase n=1 Tax=Elizabethkingia miricola TaxID=172045 RepID=A0ABD5B6G5_ELIMR|nr:nucleosidase [Elizabethkingia miricola]MDQ8749320.1 nucleosidase [Elizabethkingia miricola]NHQ65785.1 5'-methylthioadenosine/S-adenosylhomocysteine nucleosidase [Elizabethkingia miricola]NHQ70902.1 5'-methylthioadenosine/S-adenosylhomocysteine nucleosidase [Elizabethkingia miricola]NHQ76099.1 5'-methylthioadenosine/S-adenosylhomocysteine nucleosidase [Elizabethkingia miricola]OPB92058.1 nucleosidase [Elizabethkingia miricola]